MMRVIVVGAGIIGAAIAYRLAKSGAGVTIVEAGEPGGIATASSFAWINASWGNSESYFRLRVQSMGEWRELKSEIPDLPLSWTGGLIWDLPPPELEAFAAEHGSWGYALRRVDRIGALAIEPGLLDPPDLAFHATEEGVVEPRLAALAILGAAAKFGALIVAGTRLLGFEFKGDRVLGAATSRGPIGADAIVIAAGAQTAALAGMAGFDLPLTTPPGLLVHTTPHRRLLNGLVLAPDIHVRQSQEGRLIAGSDFAGTLDKADIGQSAKRLFEELRRIIDCPPDIELAYQTLGHRPMPGDGLPAIGRVPGCEGLHVAVMHSGITLAPAVSRLVAQEVIAGEATSILAPYELGRFVKAA